MEVLYSWCYHGVIMVLLWCYYGVPPPLASSWRGRAFAPIFFARHKLMSCNKATNKALYCRQSLNPCCKKGFPLQSLTQAPALFNYELSITNYECDTSFVPTHPPLPTAPARKPPHTPARSSALARHPPSPHHNTHPLARPPPTPPPLNATNINKKIVSLS
ncbi:MAG: hypothetical protein LBQ31_01395 [Bacteroidales bacterium]|jgi:hypothetical protein|nr:hypothetical protein [Bacteroidales bacterium]